MPLFQTTSEVFQLFKYHATLNKMAIGHFALFDSVGAGFPHFSRTPSAKTCAEIRKSLPP